MLGCYHLKLLNKCFFSLCWKSTLKKKTLKRPYNNLLTSSVWSLQGNVRPRPRCINRELKQRRRRRQRERQKCKRFILAKQQRCTCITLYCTFLCCRCTQFCRGRELTKTISFSFLNFATVLQKLTPKKSANISRIKRDRISVIA